MCNFSCCFCVCFFIKFFYYFSCFLKSIFFSFLRFSLFYIYFFLYTKYCCSSWFCAPSMLFYVLCYFSICVVVIILNVAKLRLNDAAFFIFKFRYLFKCNVVGGVKRREGFRRVLIYILKKYKN